MEMRDFADSRRIDLPLYLPQGAIPDHLLGQKFTITTEEPNGLSLIFEDKKLGLKDFNTPQTGTVCVDFTAPAMQFRAKQGAIKNEAVARAMGIKGNQRIEVIDATAGLGRDAFIMMALGAKVTLLERSPVVAALLVDGIYRARHSQKFATHFLMTFNFYRVRLASF